MRALIYIPIIHSALDLGSLSDGLRRALEEAFGAEAWARRSASVEAMWEGIRQMLLALPLPWERARLYQDGLPICGREREIVQELASRGSVNHQLLVELQARGAALMGTESPDLLMAEYGRARRLVQAAQRHEPDAAVAALRREGEVILHQRDAFVARRIDTTLRDGETGILFLGLLHRVDELLAGKVELRQLIHNLPFEADPWKKLEEPGHGQ